VLFFYALAGTASNDLSVLNPKEHFLMIQFFFGQFFSHFWALGWNAFDDRFIKRGL